jgi:hypothetical protein
MYVFRGGNSVNHMKHWQDRAAHMRALVETATNAETQAFMLKLAAGYDRMADRAQKRSDATGLPKQS